MSAVERMCVAAMLALLVAGCNGNAPSGEVGGATGLLPPPPAGAEASKEAAPAPSAAAPAVAPAAPASAEQALPAGAAADHITAFRGASVVLYTAEASNEGERVSASTFALPLPVRSSSPSSRRVEVMTIYGPRWIARSEVKSMGAAQAGPVSHTRPQN